MSKKLVRKALLLFAVELLCLAALGLFLMNMQTYLTVEEQKKDTKEKIEQMDDIIAAADESAAHASVTYDDVYQAKAEGLAYMANNLSDFEPTDDKMKEYADLTDVSNVILIEGDGTLVAASQETPADFTRERFNQLRAVMESGQPSEPFEVDFEEQTYRYYGSKIDADTMMVVEQDPEELHTLLDNTSTWKSMLRNVGVGLNGYAFVISAKDYTFLYHPDEDLIGQDALDAGVSVESLEDNYYGWITVGNENLYCGIKSTEDAYIACAVTEDEINSSRNLTVGIVLFVFFSVITVVVLYAIFVMQEEERKREKQEQNRKVMGAWYYNKAIGHKVSMISIVGLVLILIVTFYMQTLFSLSRQSMSTNSRTKEVERTIERYKEEADLSIEQYNERYLNKCQVAGYILERNPELANSEDLKNMSAALDIEFIMVYDEKGHEVASDSSYRNFSISTDPEDQSYEFLNLLQGVEYVIQEAQNDELSGEFRQYIGVPLHAEDGDVTGMIQIAVTPSRLEEILENTSIDQVLQGIKVGANGFAFAVDKKDKVMTYYPEDKLIGRKAASLGMEKKQFVDEYCNYIDIRSDRYYGSSLETEDSYIYVVVPEEETAGTRGYVTAASVCASFVCLAILFVLLTFGRVKEGEQEEAEMDDDSMMVDVVNPDGVVKKTQSASSRWSNFGIHWDDKTPQQRVGSVLQGLLSMLALIICVTFIFQDRFFDDDSIFMYILNGKWERGVNIFAITNCIFIICAVNVITMLIRRLLRVLARTSGPRGETVYRLLRSVVKYLSVILMLYYCFALVGVDTATLLASAGILSLVIGLGAQTLISDILAGLFIIFEGEFRVGDIVTVGDWRGTVVEIGVRTTKIEDGSQNIKVVSNSSISGVINMTKQYSYASCDVGIEYSESLERVENILEKEFPNIKKRLPAIKDGPFYKGVVALADSSVIIRIVVQCAEADRAQMERDLNREMKLILDKYDINIPFPQIVINEPSVAKEATVWEKMQADKFAADQKEAAKNLEDEDEFH